MQGATGAPPRASTSPHIRDRKAKWIFRVRAKQARRATLIPLTFAFPIAAPLSGLEDPPPALPGARSLPFRNHHRQPRSLAANPRSAPARRAPPEQPSSQLAPRAVSIAGPQPALRFQPARSTSRLLAISSL